MTQEEKQLLLKDLCARLPYGVKMSNINAIHNGLDLPPIIIDISDYENSNPLILINSGFIPHLRPISSITQEEYKEFNKKYDIEYNYLLNGKPGHTIESVSMNAFEIDFYNSHHIDYRGLIEKGLALEAKEGMYV